MSTDYRITGRGTRLTMKRLTELVEELGGSVQMRGKSACASIGDAGFLHFYNVGVDAWNEWTRYGESYPAADAWEEKLAEAGRSVLSEHDEKFWRPR